MREFYEQWMIAFTNRPSLMGDLDCNGKVEYRPLPMGELASNATTANRALATNDLYIVENVDTIIDLGLLDFHIDGFNESCCSANEFFG